MSQTTSQKIETYLSCLEAGERVPVTHFTEAYPDAAESLRQLRREGKVRLVALALVARFCEEQGCERADLVEGDREVFGWVEAA